MSQRGLPAPHDPFPVNVWELKRNIETCLFFFFAKEAAGVERWQLRELQLILAPQSGSDFIHLDLNDKSV